jgi:hypothetical protein
LTISGVLIALKTRVFVWCASWASGGTSVAVYS